MFNRDKPQIRKDDMISYTLAKFVENTHTNASTSVCSSGFKESLSV